jgi:hypothetical protein
MTYRRRCLGYRQGVRRALLYQELLTSNPRLQLSSDVPVIFRTYSGPPVILFEVQY